MDQEIIVIDDDVSQQKKVAKSIKRRSTAAIPTKKPIKRSKKITDGTEIITTQTMHSPTQSNVTSNSKSTPTLHTTELDSKKMAASPSNDSLHNGIMNIAQELAMNRNNGTNSISPELPTATTAIKPDQTPIITTNTPTRPHDSQPNNIKQVKISSLLSTTVTPTHRRLLNPGNGSMEQSNNSNIAITTTTPTPNGSTLFAKSMQLLNNNSNNNNLQESNVYIPSIKTTPMNSITYTTTTLPQKSSTSTTKKKTSSIKAKKDPSTPKPIKAKKTQSLSEIPPSDKDSMSKSSSTAPSTPKVPATKTNTLKKKKTTTTSNTTTVATAATKTKSPSTASSKVKSLLTLKPKPPTTNTPNPPNMIKTTNNPNTPAEIPKPPSFGQNKVKKTTSTVGSTATKTKNTTKTKSGTTPKIGATGSNPSSINTTPAPPADKKKITPKTLIQSPAINPPSLVKSTPVAKGDMMINKIQKKPVKEEKAVILDIPLYNTSSNDYLDENGTVVVNVLKLINSKENVVKTDSSIEEEKLKKRNMFMNGDDATKLRSEEDDTEAIDDDDEEKTDPNAEPKKKAHPMKGKSQIGKYDIEDPFIDDAELLWDEQRAGTKDGFFVFFGPLVEKGEVPKVGRATSSLKRSKR